MPVYRLGREPVFPPPESASPDGLLAFGGQINARWLKAAYAEGIFPWFNEPPILWWSPDPRLVLFPQEIRISRSLRSTLRKKRFEVRFDTSFPAVMEACATASGRDEQGTWISQQVVEGYVELFHQGFCHSVESWAGGKLVGGLYGVCIGKVFFGESMFARATDASKVALVALTALARDRAIEWIDCQVRTEHLVSMGAREIRRSEFVSRVRQLVRDPTPEAPWSIPSNFPL